MPFITFRPASATWSRIACVPITKADAPVACLGQQMLHGAADGDHVRERGLHADAPELRHVVLAGVPAVVGGERDPLARGAQRGDGVHRALHGLVADPHAAVEVEDHLVVGAEKRGERGHAPKTRWLPSCSCPARSSLLLALCALALAACGSEGAEEGPARGGRGARRAGRGARPAAARRSRRPSPARRAASASRSPNLDPEKTYEVKLRHQLRLVHHPARPEDRAQHRGLVRLAGRQGLLRRHGLPPHRPRVRDPGRRSRPAPAPAAPATRSVDKPPEDATYTRGVVAMAKTGDEAARHRRQPVLRGHRPGRRPAARVRAARQGRQGDGRGDEDRRSSAIPRAGEPARHCRPS